MPDTLQDSVSSNNRRHKTALTKVSEWLSIPIFLLLIGVAIQIGEYKANFANMCSKVEELKQDMVVRMSVLSHAMDASAAENKAAQADIQQELSQVRERMARMEGREARMAKQ